MNGGGLRETIWLTVCEAEPRWVPMLKSLLARQPNPSVTFRVAATPNRPTPSELAEPPLPTLLLAEVETSGIDKFMIWCSAARRAANVEVVALLGRGMSGLPAERLDAAEDALREAGAVAVLRSTTDLSRAVELAKRHADQTAKRLDAACSPQESVWRRLPWQRAAGPLR